MRIKAIIIAVMLMFCAVSIALGPGIWAATQDKGSGASPPNFAPFIGQNYFWSEAEILSEPIFGQDINLGTSFDPKMAVEGDNIYLVWQDTSNLNGAGTDLDVFYRYYNGSGWSEIQIISEPIPGVNTNNWGSRSPRIAVENSSIFVVWADDTDLYGAGSDSDIFYISNISGAGWSEVQVISEPVPGQDINKGARYPTIAVNNSKIYVTWASSNNTNNAGTDRDIFFRCNLTGNGWEDFQIISEPVMGLDIDGERSDFPEIAVENGNIYVIWEGDNDTIPQLDDDMSFRCNLTGIGWEDIQVISEPVMGQNNDYGDSFYGEIAVENGKIYTVWVDQSNYSGAETDYDIFYRSNLTGSGWEDIQVLSEPVVGMNYNIGNSYSPAIEVENGNIYVCFYDLNATYNSGTDRDVYFTCNLSGGGWEPLEIVSEPDPGQDLNPEASRDPDVAVVEGVVCIAYRDENNTSSCGPDQDIFFKWRSGSLRLNQPIVDPLFGNTSTIFNYSINYSHIDNKVPIKIVVNLSGIEYPMLETDPADTDYSNGKMYYYQTTLNISDNHTYKFWTSDGENITYTNLVQYPIVYNTAPNITTHNNLTAIEDIYYVVDYEYEDIDLINVGQIGTWNWSTNASWLNFNSTTGILNGTPSNNDIGTYWVNISINDTIDIDHTNFTITVINVNDAPVITTNDVDLAPEDSLYEVDYEATDIDSPQSQLIWEMNTNASWLNFNTVTALLSGTPTNDDVGEYWVEITVNDTIDFDETNFTLTVENVNDRPAITTMDVTTAPIDVLYEVDYNATDIDSVLTQQVWSLVTNASWLDLNSETGLLSGTPTKTEAGWYNVNITVNDGDGGEDWHEFILTVLLDNYPPTIITEDVTSAVVDELYEVDYDATDADTPLDELLWTIDTNATWLIIEKNLGILTGTPKSSHIGSYRVNVTVTDDEGAFDFHDFKLNVYLTLNQPPDITTVDQTSVTVGKDYLVDYNATDDRTSVANLRWYLQTNASWLDLDLKTGELSGTPSLNDVGTYWVEVSVFDTEDGWDVQNFTLRVSQEPPTEERMELTNPTLTPTEGDTETEFTFTIHYRHLDDQGPVYVQLVIDGELHNMNLSQGENPTNGNYAVTLKLSEGVHTYYFVTSDGSNTVRSDDQTTPDIKARGKDGSDKTSMDWLIWVAVIIIVIIIVIILLLIFLKKRKPQEEPEPAPPAETPAETPVVVAPPPQPVPVPTLAPTVATPTVVPTVVQPVPMADVDEAEE